MRRSDSARPEILESLKETWGKATPREKQIFSEHAKAQALAKIKKACEQVLGREEGNDTAR